MPASTEARGSTAGRLLSQVYTPFAYLLTAETERKVVDFNNSPHALADVTAEIKRFDTARKDVDKRSYSEAARP